MLVVQYVYVEKIRETGSQIIEFLKKLRYDEIPEFSTLINELESAIERNDTSSFTEIISELSEKLKKKRKRYCHSKYTQR